MDARAVTEPHAIARSRGDFVEIALNRPLQQSFTYRIPQHLRGQIRHGQRILVPFGRRKEVGICVGLDSEAKIDVSKIRSIDRILDFDPLLDSQLLKLTQWVSEYYVCSWGEALAAALPPSLKRESPRRTVSFLVASEGASQALEVLGKKFDRQYRALRILLEGGGSMGLAELKARSKLSDSPIQSLVKKGLARLESRVMEASPLDQGEVSPSLAPDLNDSQKKAISEIVQSVQSRAYRAFLLYGITGSGKTEVYLHAIREALAAGRSAIVLVPEIALTPQTVSRFRSRFESVAVLHSRLNDSQRLEQWRKIQKGEAKIVIGARSAVFAPIPKLGLIVVDEEHEPSFKQQNVPRYHARDVAVYRAHLAGATVVLGSATPSLESFSNSQNGKYKLLSLPQRVLDGQLPPIHLVDMRNEVAEQKNFVVLSRLLVQKVEQALARGEQTILFLNRRGFTPVLFCRQCGTSVRCRRCDVSLTYHRKIQRAVCHTCCEEIPPPRECLECGAGGILYLGTGSEKVEARIREFFPQARIARMDSDTMVRREDYERVLDQFKEKQIDILVGTQMIAKGLDFPNVTVVGVISADTSLHVPDFRSSERTFQLISQVAGRAGRGSKSGVVIVQSAMPEHESIRAALEHDFEGFARREMEHRRRMNYPPFGRAVRILLEGKEESKVQHAAAVIRKKLEERPIRGVEILGPAAAPIAWARGKSRWHLLIKILPPEKWKLLRPAVQEISQISLSSVRVAIDVDPISIL